MCVVSFRGTRNRDISFPNALATICLQQGSTQNVKKQGEEKTVSLVEIVKENISYLNRQQDFPEHFARNKQVILLSFQYLESQLSCQLRRNWISSIIHRLACFIFGSSYVGQEELDKREALRLIQEQKLDELDLNPQSHLAAVLRFEKEWETRFSCKPVPFEGLEFAAYLEITDSIWKKCQNDYARFADRMEECVIGSHLVIDDPNLVDRIQFYALPIQNPADRKTAFLTKGYLEKRGSSHYGPVGIEDQFHIRGKRFREDLFFKGELLYHPQNKTVYSKNGKGIYAHDPAKPHTLPLAEQEKLIQEGYEVREFYWGQTENTSDGPDWPSYLWHRGIDFLFYKFLKDVLKQERCQVSGYSSSKGRGIGDQKPIIVI